MILFPQSLILYLFINTESEVDIDEIAGKGECILRDTERSLSRHLAGKCPINFYILSTVSLNYVLPLYDMQGKCAYVNKNDSILPVRSVK